MKKLFTVDDFAVAFVSALGYGYGETISRLFGWPELVCGLASFAVGVVAEGIISRIAFSKEIQKNKGNRVMIYGAIFLLFLLGHYISVQWMGVSLMDYLLEEFMWVVGLPVLGFAVNLLIRWLRIRKIRRLYGDGSKGYVFDVKKEDIEETNRQNQPVSGEYDEELAVRTRTGIYVGEKLKKTISYLGIPYAKPPVGDLRWRAPEPLPDSDAVFEAENFGASAIQVEHGGAILKHHRQSEDCLYLNVCVGAQKTEGKKPVLVLFHHGDFTYGGSADPLLDGANYISAHPDTVFVSFNYRLGIFGFIDFSGIPEGEAYPDTLNLGLLDQIAALKWVRENIAAFGGDPDRVTAVGFEAGATSILLLAAGGHAQGLFQRAFVFNGLSEAAYTTPDGAGALAADLLKETKTASMEALLQLDTATLKEAAQRLWGDMCAPTCDGKWLPADVNSALRNGAASGIEFVIGIPGNEMQVFRSFIGDRNYEDLIAAALSDMQNSQDAHVAEAAQKYIETQPDAADGSDRKEMLVEQWFVFCMYRCAASLSEGGNKVHVMYWNEKPLIENLGSGTVDAAAVLLGNGDASQMYGNVMNEDLSEALQTLLNKFMSGEAMQLYHNEIVGTDAFDWEAFPKALIVADKELQCDTIEDRLTRTESFMDIMKQPGGRA